MNSFVESVLRAFLVEKFCVKPKEEVCFSRFEEEQNIGELFGLTSTMIFGRIEYLKNNESQMTESIAVKQSADLNFESEVDYYSMQFANEIHFFSKVIPTISNLTNGEFESFFPKFLYSYSKTMPSYNRDVIIFENLRALDFCVASPDKMQKHSSTKKDVQLLSLFPDYAHLSMMMRKLGQFHAHSIKAAKLNPNHFELIANFQTRLHENCSRKYSNMLRVQMKKYIRLLSTNPLYKTKLASIEEIVDNLENSLLSVNNPNSISVVCHGDYTVFNVLFKYDENGSPVDMKMLDLGLWRLSSPVLDLGHLLYVNSDQEMRDKHWDDLMNEYFNGLADVLAIQDLPSRLKIMEEFRLSGWYAFLIVSFFIVNKIAAATNLPNIFEEIWNHYPDVSVVNIPAEDLQKLFENNDVGGTRATEAAINVLKDMVDRKFI